MNDQIFLHITKIYLASINVVIFFIYGIDKWYSTSGCLQTMERKKEKRSKRCISEATLLAMASIGGSIGALLGMKMRHHKTLYKKFRYGVPFILIVQTLLFFNSCKTNQQADTVTLIQNEAIQEHSPTMFLVMYDVEIGKEPLLKAIEEYKCDIIYDYSIINGMALKKPYDKSLEEAIQYFKTVKGVVNVEYDHIYHLTDPVKPRLEIE